MIGVPLLLLLIVPAEEPVKPKFPLGKETTYVTGPLDKDGYIDYEAALNERLRKGVTPETNANVLIWKAIGPRPEGGARMHSDYFKALGIEEPPETGDHFIGLRPFLKDRLKLDPAGEEAVFKQLGWAMQRPWTAKDYPHIAEWLMANEKQLAIVTQASKRPHYFNPLIAPRTETGRGSLIGALLPTVQSCRGMAAALAAQAMLKFDEGKFEEAWQDLLACHRLGRLVSRGGCLIDCLVGIAIDQIASRADLVYLERAPLAARQFQDRANDLRALPRMSTTSEIMDVNERLAMLEILQFVRRKGPGILEALQGGPAKSKPNPELAEALATADWEPALRNVNSWFGRVVAALRIEDRASREKELDKFAADLKSLKEKATVSRNDLNGENVGNLVISLLMPAFQKAQTASDRWEQTRRNLGVAFALAAYRRDTGHYPAKLDDLAPKYLAAIPADLFSGKPLIYRPTANGYLLYSVGVNGKDDGGRTPEDNPPGDDLCVRMPLPKLK